MNPSKKNEAYSAYAEDKIDLLRQYVKADDLTTEMFRWMPTDDILKFTKNLFNQHGYEEFGLSYDDVWDIDERQEAEDLVWSHFIPFKGYEQLQNDIMFWLDAKELEDMMEFLTRQHNLYEKKYDVGYGNMGNGTTVWNRAEEQYGDYKIIAHINPKGIITYREELPADVKKEIEKNAVKWYGAAITEGMMSDDEQIEALIQDFGLGEWPVNAPAHSLIRDGVWQINIKDSYDFDFEHIGLVKAKYVAQRKTLVLRSDKLSLRIKKEYVKLAYLDVIMNHTALVLELTNGQTVELHINYDV